jgi:hypothetical protein
MLGLIVLFWQVIFLSNHLGGRRLLVIICNCKYILQLMVKNLDLSEMAFGETELSICESIIPINFGTISSTSIFNLIFICDKGEKRSFPPGLWLEAGSTLSLRIASRHPLLGGIFSPQLLLTSIMETGDYRRLVVRTRYNIFERYYSFRLHFVFLFIAMKILSFYNSLSITRTKSISSSPPSQKTLQY